MEGALRQRVRPCRAPAEADNDSHRSSLAGAHLARGRAAPAVQQHNRLGRTERCRRGRRKSPRSPALKAHEPPSAAVHVLASQTRPPLGSARHDGQLAQAVTPSPADARRPSPLSPIGFRHPRPVAARPPGERIRRENLAPSSLAPGSDFVIGLRQPVATTGRGNRRPRIESVMRISSTMPGTSDRPGPGRDSS